jgi:lipase chaperone LimK
LALAIGVAVLGAAVGWLGLGDSSEVTTKIGTRHLDTTGGISLLAGGGSEGLPPDAARGAAESLAVSDIETRLLIDGSLRGAELDGSWGQWADGALRPDIALRQRFDQLLTTVGELSTDELRVFIASRAERDTSPEQAQTVLSLWDRYLTLQQVRFPALIDLNRPASWSRELQAHQLARREHLGPVWADAFFGEEEQRFRDLIAEHSQTAAVRPSVSIPNALSPSAELPSSELHQLRVATYGREAAERLREEDLAQAAWQTRLDNARNTITRLGQAPELSEPQREEAVTQWLAQNFPAAEQVRARALLGLP